MEPETRSKFDFLVDSLREVLPTYHVYPDSKSGMTEFLYPKVVEAKLEIFSDEHPPPHFRVSYGGSSANYKISDGTRLKNNREIEIKDRKVMGWWKQHRVELAELWNSSRPTDCPVGPFDIPPNWRVNAPKK